MKKFISMVMAAAMVVSLVPATAFAANTASFKVVGAKEVKEDDDAVALTKGINGPQLQITITDVNTVAGDYEDDFELTLDFENIEVKGGKGLTWDGAQIVRETTTAGTYTSLPVVETISIDECEAEDSSITIKFTEDAQKELDLRPGDVIILPFNHSFFYLTDDSEGTIGTVTVSGDFGESEAMPVASVLAEGLDVTVAGKPVEVAEEEVVELKDVTVESVVGNFTGKEEIKVKIKGGFEFLNLLNDVTVGGTTYPKATIETRGSYSCDPTDCEEDEFAFTLSGTNKIVFKGLVVEATTADAGTIGEISVSAKGYEADADEAVEVIAEAVVMSVDEDDDVPEMYAGTDVDEVGLQTDADHKALKVTIEESVADAWDTADAWTLSLPEGVYVTEIYNLKGDKVVNWKEGGIDAAFQEAYKDGDYEYFDFGRRAFEVQTGEKAKIEFVLELVAEPEFVGDVVLTLEGEGISEDAQEVVIAKFVAPYTVEAAQNDLVIDYRNTVVDTDVVVKEAEVGLWDDNAGTAAVFTFSMDHMKFEDDAVVTVDEESDMTLKDVKAAMGFKVDEESDEEAAAVTINGIELYMERNLPAGAYDLVLDTTMSDYFMIQDVYGAAGTVAETYYDFDAEDIEEAGDAKYGHTVKEGFVNVITAGRDQDDASFTKKVVVPVGAMEIVAGEDVVALDVPAYINAAGYTMLPVRAVAVALGINTNNVIWDQATKTVTILYGQRIITMTVGQKVINVNGSAIPASAAVEVVNGRTFLGLRDLATALGVVDITWDAATQTATLNGGN